ncbi:hypothetical protein OHA25_16870 [Nonomuraea sp. NBC_00507]
MLLILRLVRAHSTSASVGVNASDSSRLDGQQEHINGKINNALDP